MIDALVALVLVSFTGPDEQVIEVNPDKVVTIRSIRPTAGGHFAGGVRCLIHTDDGHFVSVVEDCPTVRRRLDAARGKQP